MAREKKTRKTSSGQATRRREREVDVHRTPWLLYGLVGLIIAGTALFAAHFYKQHSPSAVPTRSAHNDDSAGYIDSSTCATCHSAITQSFHKTGMGRSMYRPTSSNRVEDYSSGTPLYNVRSDMYYKMIERDGSFYQQRYQLDPDGRKINAFEERVDYVIGSGDQARSYLHRDAENRLIELPVTWYTENRGYWAMTPGYDQLHQKDFHGAVSFDCFFCHNAYPRPGIEESVVNSGERVFPPTIPEGIDCQRCHGPGQAHVAAANNVKSTIDQIRNAIVNPARLSRDRQLEVCMECHLSTSQSQDANVSKRFGRGDFSYRPGQALPDYKLYFDRADNEQHKDEFEIVDVAYRLSFSSCFKNSAMTCLTCHDPHVEDHSQAAEARYLKVCESCHQSVRHATALPAKADCVSCHMPKRRSQFAVHIVLTDHYIQKFKPAGDLTKPMSEPEAVPQSHGKIALFYPKQLPDTPENKLYLASAELRGGNLDKSKIEQFEKVINEIKPTEAEFYADLGQAYLDTGDKQNAEQWFGEAHRRAPQYRPIMVQLVQALMEEGKYQQAADLLKEALKGPPADSALLADLGNAYARMGNLDEAQTELKQSIATNPETAEAYALLGVVAIQQGNGAEATKNFEEALRIEPDLSEASSNLGRLSLGNQDFKSAEYFLKKAVTLDPSDADAHHAYGMLMLLKRQYASSVRELRAAISLVPNDVLTRSDLGDVLAQEGDLAGATQAYDEALRIRPDFAQANLGLGVILRRQGRIEESMRLCKLAAQSADDSIREAALQCMK